MKYKFIKNLNHSDEWNVIPSESVCLKRLSETYNEFGQKIGHFEADDWIILDSESAKLANKFEPGWEESEFVSASNRPELFTYLIANGVETDGQYVHQYTYLNERHNLETIFLEDFNNFRTDWIVEEDRTIILSLTNILSVLNRITKKSSSNTVHTWESSKHKINRPLRASPWIYTIEKL